MLKSSVQQTCYLPELLIRRIESKHNKQPESPALVFSEHACSLNAGLKHSRSDLVFKQPQTVHTIILFSKCTIDKGNP